MEQPRKGRKGAAPKTAELKIWISARRKTGEIHIYGLGGRPITVGKNPQNKRGHPRLYALLKDELKRRDMWPLEMEERARRK